MTRVTQGMLTANYMVNENRNLTNMQKMQSQLSSKKEISRASDNPYKVSRIMQLYTEIDANKQFKENVKDTSSWLDATDTSLGQLNNVFARIRELQVSVGNGTYDEQERIAIQLEIRQKITETVQILNNNFDGAYIFGGTKSTSKPVIVDGNGNIQYANKDGAAINIYKDTSTATAKFTSSSTPAVASAVLTTPLSATDVNLLETQLTNGATSTARKEEIKMMIGTREKVYVKTYENALTLNSSGTLVTPAITALTQDQKDMLQSELNDTSTSGTRKAEIQQLLNTDFSSGTISLYKKDSISYTPNSSSTSSFCTITVATSTSVTSAKASLDTELNDVINPPSDKRRAEIYNVLETITPKVDNVYKAPVTGDISTSNQNKPVVLSDAEVNALKTEYNGTSDPIRKTEIEGMLIINNQINSDLKVEVSEGVMMSYNSTAFDVLEYKDKDGNVKNVSDLLNRIVNNLNPKGSVITNLDGTKSVADPSKVSGELITEMDSAIKQLLSERARVGALSNRMEASELRNDADNESMVAILAKTEDIDFVEKTMEYAELQTVYMAALQVSGKILPMTLLNYLS